MSKPIRKGRLILFSGIIALGLLALAEAGARVFWASRGLSFFHCQRQIQEYFYPELRFALEDEIEEGDDIFDILLLGGSVLNPYFGAIENLLGERLARETGASIRINNLALGGHSTRDSLFKYQHLADKHFDLVIVYHGINEARANNCAREVFRDDYSHYSFYRLVNAYEAKAGSRHFALPYTLYFASMKLGEALGFFDFVPTHRSSYEQMEYGKDIKTSKPFHDNLSALLDIAKQRNETVVLMTFAYYVAPGYAEQKFWDRKLDYTRHLHPIETWGKPEYIVPCLEAHNAAIREVAGEYGNAILVEQEGRIPESGPYFNDICHLTNAGCRVFVDNLLPVVIDRIQAEFPP